MSTDELHLDAQTLARAKLLAAEQSLSVEEFVAEAIRRYEVTSGVERAPSASMIGLFADVPELVDQIVQEAYRDRESWPHRVGPR